MLSFILRDMDTRKATGEVLGAWLEKNEEKPFLRVLAMLLTAGQYREELEQGYVRGFKKGVKRAQDWYNRQQAALEKGEPFDEPPPWDDKPKTNN